MIATTSALGPCTTPGSLCQTIACAPFAALRHGWSPEVSIISFQSKIRRVTICCTAGFYWSAIMSSDAMRGDSWSSVDTITDDEI